LEVQNGPTLSFEEAMAMTEINSDGYNIYAIQKGDVTFLAWNTQSGVHTKIMCW
jgi:hypothetical protein